MIVVVLSIAIVIILAILYKLASDTTLHGKPLFTLTTRSTKTLGMFLKNDKSSKAKITENPHQDSASNEVHIEGIMSMGGKMTALINGDVYEEGQRVNGKTISDISFDSVTILDNGEIKILSTKTLKIKIPKRVLQVESARNE